MSMGRKRRDRQIAASCQRSDRSTELLILGGLPIADASSPDARPLTETTVAVRGQRYLIRGSLQLPLGRDPAEVDAAAKRLGLDLPSGLSLHAKAAMVCFGQAPNAHNLSFCEIALGLKPWPVPSELNPQRLKRVADAVIARREKEVVA
jgi:hypothetical protein